MIRSASATRQLGHEALSRPPRRVLTDNEAAVYLPALVTVFVTKTGRN
jgi:hypothetical protein